MLFHSHIHSPQRFIKGTQPQFCIFMCQLFQHFVREISWSPDLIGLSSLCSHLESGNFYFHNLTAACLFSVVTILGLLNPSTNFSVQLQFMLGLCSPSSYSKLFSHCSFWFLRLKNILPFPINFSFKVSQSGFWQLSFYSYIP